MPTNTPSDPAPTRPETAQEKFKRLVDGIAAKLDDDFPSGVVADRSSTIDDDSGFYGTDSTLPAFVAADDAAFKADK